jgi:hypothetical protein
MECIRDVGPVMRLMADAQRVRLFIAVTGRVWPSRRSLQVALFDVPLANKDGSENTGCSIVGMTSVWIAKGRC